MLSIQHKHRFTEPQTQLNIFQRSEDTALTKLTEFIYPQKPVNSGNLIKLKLVNFTSAFCAQNESDGRETDWCGSGAGTSA